MRTPRRFLPSLSLLQAFEATARLNSVTMAAQELSLTQSAVSRQIRALEEQIGTALFHREKQSLRLTHGGAAYAREVREALARISQASMNLRANPHGGTLSLAILPTFGTRWLAPRLPAFLAQHPGITINLVTRLRPIDFAAEAVDAAIQFGRADWPGGRVLRLMGEQVVPACAPDLAARFGFATVSDLPGAPLLHLTSRPDAWERYLEHHGIDPGQIHGMLFDQFATVAQAAASGLGVALLPTFLIEDEIARGRLVCPVGLPMRSKQAYHLCWPADHDDHPPLSRFRDWLVRETRAFEAASP
ncbi:LysR substrate-binding domain-containing protein [Paenirhodobacter populi]|uniref:LysR family transcriptional regulator n=1 Tax=Paenirhodobacter populi TaxID=2306993 RepID=A0A443J387_9RHOB|nr:LysR substrate-binding domain-containing protein [Sinirhodobacter populi]RWR14796.1 LysR family transcriptional regulator [Sinirhodobacter populi]